jgi:peptidoglycan/xylan/chitin deacetylase (PgdA/CDA1 family)
MKDLAKATLFGAYKYSGVLAAQERLSYWRGNDFLSIVLVHRVTDIIPPDSLTVSTAWFRDFCRLMRDRFHVVSLSEAMRVLRSGERLNQRMVAITFDDCYLDNLFAARVLAEHGLPACFFIPTAFPGTNHVFPWDVGLKRMMNLGWDDIREMASMGHEIGSHSVTHADISLMGDEEAAREIQESKQTLEAQLGQHIRWFAYPFGQQSHFQIERLPRIYEAGYEGCFSGFGGFVYPSMKHQIIPRIPVPNFRSMLSLELYLTGCLEWAYALKRRVISS